MFWHCHASKAQDRRERALETAVTQPAWPLLASSPAHPRGHLHVPVPHLAGAPTPTDSTRLGGQGHPQSLEPCPEQGRHLLAEWMLCEHTARRRGRAPRVWAPEPAREGPGPAHCRWGQRHISPGQPGWGATSLSLITCHTPCSESQPLLFSQLPSPEMVGPAVPAQGRAAGTRLTRVTHSEF